MTYLIQLLTAFTGSLGFAILFNIRQDKLLPASLGGLLSWAVYLLCGIFTDSDPLRFLISSVIYTFYAEIMARKMKSPATLFIVPAFIPLIPGGSLYHTMQYLITGQDALFRSQAVYTLLLAGAIAVGILLAMTIWSIIANVTHLEIMKRHR